MRKRKSIRNCLANLGDRQGRLVEAIIRYLLLSVAYSLLLLLICLGAIAPPVEAALCRNLDGREVCIVRIKRSAKYYWEYRTVVSIDGQKKPLVIYNCRDRTITRKNKYPIPFKSNSAGDLVCSLFDK